MANGALIGPGILEQERHFHVDPPFGDFAVFDLAFVVLDPGALNLIQRRSGAESCPSKTKYWNACATSSPKLRVPSRIGS